jgi:rhomboid protease GluP
MVEEKLNFMLSNHNFKRINSNVDGVYFLFRFMDNEVEIISVIHVENGDEISEMQYIHLLEQMKNNFISRGIRKANLLSIIITKAPDKVKGWCLQEKDNHWIIDSQTNQLIIYETQSFAFAAVQNEIERILQEERQELAQSEQSENKKGGKLFRRQKNKGVVLHKSRWLTPINTLIIGINIIVYVLMYHTNLLATWNYDDGVLRWTSIIKKHEYYRLLTAMFMHANIDHLANNMLVLLFIGDNVERVAGKVQFFLIYFGSGIVAGITSISYNMMINDMAGSIGASGAIFGVVGAMLYILIVNKGRVEEIGGLQIVLFIIFSLYGGIQSVQIDEAAHIGGFLAGIVLAVLLYRKRKRNV